MPKRSPTIDILCRVIDNFGDIGVVYRLARALSSLPSALPLRLVVDDLASFAALCPAIDRDRGWQSLGSWSIARWDGPGEEALADFGLHRPAFVVECFACGRPDWLEQIIFDDEHPAPCHIVDLEYLSAESFAEDFHRMASLTRSSSVRKTLFFPGFTALTGGLILDREFMAQRALSTNPDTRDPWRSDLAARLSATYGLSFPEGNRDLLWVLIFSYERDYTAVIRDLCTFNADRPILLVTAAGKSQGPVLKACSDLGITFPRIDLPFISQEDWDSLLLAADFAIVRGEDSFSRAALSGRPFLWQAYPQDKVHHMIKVEAFLDQLGCVPGSPLRDLYLSFNEREKDSPETTGRENLLPVLRNLDGLTGLFGHLAANLTAIGDLSESLADHLASGAQTG